MKEMAAMLETVWPEICKQIYVYSYNLCHVIQIMNVYEFSGAIIFMSWKIEHAIQRGEAELNRMFNLSTNENNCTIERMKKHSLFVLYNT